MKKVVFVFEDLPIENGNGYSTYNRAFISCINDAEYSVSLIITGSNHRSYIYSPQKVLNLNVSSIKVINSLLSSRRLCIPSIKGILKLLYRKFLKGRVKVGDDKLVKIGRWLTGRERAAVSNEILKIKPDVVFVDTIFRSFDFKTLAPGCKTVLIGHDVFFERCASMISTGLTPSPMITQELEIGVISQYDDVIAITDHDGAIYQSNHIKNVHVLASPISKRASVPAKSQTKDLFYLGSRAHHNVSGLLWFLNEVWPSILATDPQVTLYVVGSVCELIPKTFSNVKLLGMLDDFTQICDVSAVAINPVLSGSGLKIKTLDYLANGLPCITTELGAEGFRMGSEDGPILIANNAEDFSRIILSLIHDGEKLSLLSTEALKLADHFSFDGFKERLGKIL
ncbi:MAG: glycosyltransferase [Methylophilus sp.]